MKRVVFFRSGYALRYDFGCGLGKGILEGYMLRVFDSIGNGYVSVWGNIVCFIDQLEQFFGQGGRQLHHRTPMRLLGGIL